MFCHIVNQHEHAVQIRDVEFPLTNNYLVEPQKTLSLPHSMKFSLFCPTCQIGNFTETSHSINVEWNFHRFYYIEDYTVQGSWWWCPCSVSYFHELRYLELVAPQHSRTASQNFVFV